MRGPVAERVASCGQFAHFDKQDIALVDDPLDVGSELECAGGIRVGDSGREHRLLFAQDGKPGGDLRAAQFDLGRCAVSVVSRGRCRAEDDASGDEDVQAGAP